jgi:catechol 2,3-dioxygenase-like lactoylglutathione lyase family enzyme
MSDQLNLLIPKLPSRNLEATKAYYQNVLDFKAIGQYPDYLLLQKAQLEIHFFLYEDLNPKENYGQCYVRVSGAEALYLEVVNRKGIFPKLGHLEMKPWGMLEFSLLDPDMNLLTFGEEITRR